MLQSKWKSWEHCDVYTIICDEGPRGHSGFLKKCDAGAGTMITYQLVLRNAPTRYIRLDERTCKPRRADSWK